MNILITGVSGFIGKNLAKDLIDNGHVIFGIDNFYNSTPDDIVKGVNFLECDIADESWLTWLKDVHIDKIIHLAAQSSGEISFNQPQYDVSTNVLGTMNVCVFAKSNNISQVIFASSMSVYGENQGMVNESVSRKPLSLYAVGKSASEDYLRIFSSQYNIDVKCLRLFNVYGNGQNLKNLAQGMVSIFLAQLLSSSENVLVKGSLDRYRDFIHVYDVVDVISTMLVRKSTAPTFEVVNVGTGVRTTVNELISCLKQVFDIEKKVKVIDGTLGDQSGIVADNCYLKQSYKNDFISFRDGVKLWKNSYDH